MIDRKYKSSLREVENKKKNMDFNEFIDPEASEIKDVEVQFSPEIYNINSRAYQTTTG